MAYAPCEVCGGTAAGVILRSPRLDGPLVRCPSCGLVYVGERRRDFTFDAADPARTQALGDAVSALGIVAREVEAAERPSRLAADRDRLARVTRHADSGRLLDVGSATGGFLAAAASQFDAEGVEPDPGTSEQARSLGLRVTTGTLADVTPPPGGFDVVTMFHVIEHLASPRAALERTRALMRAGGVVVIETPTTDNLWFRLAPGRWRQLIPDHYFFFSRATLTRLLRQTGFDPVAHVKVGRRVSLRFAADRLRRAGVPTATPLARGIHALRVEERTVYLNPGDIMEVVARAV